MSLRAPARAGSGQGKLVAALFATSVFLGTGFSIGAPVYALSRWWASRPVASTTFETRLPVAGQKAGEPPANEAMPSSAAAKSTLLLDEEVMQIAPPVRAAAIEATSEEAVASPEAPVAVLSSEPPTAPAWSGIPVSSTPFIDPVAISGVTIDPVAIDRGTIDPVAIERVTIDPVPIERVTIDPVVIDPVAIGRVTIDPVKTDRVTIDPISR